MSYILVFDYPGEDAESVACADSAAVVTALDERLGGHAQSIEAIFRELQAKGAWLDEGGQIRLHATGGAALVAPERITPAYSCANAAQQKGRCTSWCGTCLRSNS